MTKAELISKFQGCLLGGAIGDALGMPVETMTHEEIMALNGGQGVIDFMAPVQQKFKEAAKLPAGSTTDDTQLTLVVAKSLIHSRGILDIYDCAQRHVEAWRENNVTWGGSTRDAIAEIAEGRRHPRTPPKVTPNRGLGNGVVMKIAPIGLLSHLNTFFGYPINLANECLRLGAITHGDPRASIAAFAVANAIHYLVTNSIIDANTTDNRHPKVWNLLNNTIYETKLIEETVLSVDPIKVSAHLKLIDRPINLESSTNLRGAVGCGFTAIETAAFAIGTFIRHPTDFKEGVLEAVNAGGDTDTNAAVVGNLIGANLGIEGLPKEWLERCPVREELMEVAIKLAEIS